MNFDIEVIKNKLRVKYPFFGTVVVNVKYKVNDCFQFAATDGKVIYYNPIGLQNISVDEQVFVFAHEICHIAFNHILRSEGKNKNLWNIATDAVINQLLLKDGLSMPIGSIDYKEAINYNAEEFYEKLLQENIQNNQNNDSKENSLNKMQNECESRNDDNHNLWEDAVKNQKKENNNISKKQDELKDMQEIKGFQKNTEDKIKILEDLKKSLLDSAFVCSTTRGDEIKIDNIGTPTKLLDWRRLLLLTTKEKYDWSYQNAEIEYNVLKPSFDKYPFSETEIILDTSGSINTDLLKCFLRECKNIFKNSKIKVGCFDTQFYGFHEIRTINDIDNMKFEGGGGTDFNVAIESFSRNASNRVLFTDGLAFMPIKPLKVIWVVFGNEKIQPKGGKVIYIDEDYLSKSIKNDKPPRL